MTTTKPLSLNRDETMLLSDRIASVEPMQLTRILEEHADYEAASKVTPPPGPPSGPDYSGGGD